MKTEILQSLFNINFDEKTLINCRKFIELFVQYNSHTNLMSKNDLNVIFEKHIVDSLSIGLFDGFKSSKNILDIGTGGGFPSVPISIFFKNKKITAVDSIRKKIKFIELAKEIIGLDNLYPLCSRIEEMDKSLYKSFDIVTSRALSTLEQIIKYALPYLRKGGYIVAYKSKNADEELKHSEQLIKISHLKHIDTIRYSIELDENFERCLIVLKKMQA